MNDSTIAAVATPVGRSAVSVLRISGPDALPVLRRVCGGDSGMRFPARRQTFVRIRDGEGEVIDEALACYFPGPRSYTGEDLVEICCHGGLLVTRNVLRLLLESGCEAAGPGEFTQRAFLHGKMDLTQAEGVMDLISAQTSLALKAANEQLRGSIGNRTEALRRDLVGIIAHVEAFIDFPEEDIDPDTGRDLTDRLEELMAATDALLASADQGRLLREGARVVIAGPPNAGKSSLLNLLLGFERAIVHESAGTTRDTIEEVINLAGIPLRLIDTAGVRKAGNAVEREGIDRTRAEIEEADLVLLVQDASRPPRPGRTEIVAEDEAIRILNKSDLGISPGWEGANGLVFSCRTGEGLEALRGAIEERVLGSGFDRGAELVAINARHQACLQGARDACTEAAAGLQSGLAPEFVSVHLYDALGKIGEITGRTDVEEILGEIFGSFCIGK